MTRKPSSIISSGSQSIDDQIEFYPHLADRWVDEVIADGVDLDDIRDRLQATMDMMVRQRLDAITRGDHLAAERAVDAIDALKDGWRPCCTDWAPNKDARAARKDFTRPPKGQSKVQVLFDKNPKPM